MMHFYKFAREVTIIYWQEGKTDWVRGFEVKRKLCFEGVETK